MLLKAATFGFVGLMILGATCEDHRRDAESISRCIDPRRIDFDHGVRAACEAARKIAHPVDTVSTAFESRWKIGEERPQSDFQPAKFTATRF